MEDFSKAIELRPRELYRDWYESALVQLAAGNMSGYQLACAELMNSFGETTDPQVASLVAWTNVLDSTSVADWSVVINLAERATKIAADDDSLAQVALGAARYRADRFAEAVAQLTEADRQMQEAGLPSSSSPAYVWYFLALAQHGLNHQDESRQWFERAIQWKKQSLQHESQDDAATIPWNRRVTPELLEKETRSLIGG